MTGKTHGKWAFTAGLRARAFGWRGSQKAVARLKEAVSEIKAAQKRDPVAAGEGVVRLAERIWPAFEQIDTSSGALGGAVNRALDTLIPILIAAPAIEATRSRWLERLFDAIQDDGVEYLMPISERFGEIAVFSTLRNLYADRSIGMIRASWSDPTPGGYVAPQTLCLSCLLEAGRYDELCDLLALRRVRFWHDERFAAEALLRQGREEEALAHAEALLVSERPTYDARRIAAFCETVLTGLGRREEAYRRFALPHASGATYLATWRALARRYPERQGREVLVDLIAARGQKGKWFAAAKAAGDLDLALECAADHEAEPSALVRAARDFQERRPEVRGLGRPGGRRSPAVGAGLRAESSRHGSGDGASSRRRRAARGARRSAEDDRSHADVEPTPRSHNGARSRPNDVPVLPITAPYRR